MEIAILSYNRTAELERALRSLESIERDDVRVCVYEDCSPNQNLIEEICAKYSSQLFIDLVFKPSPVNLGYDVNLLRALSADAEYVLLLSDDDYFDADFSDDFLITLDQRRPDIFISPYKGTSLSRPGVHYSGDYSVNVLYDSVLFSGLTFRVGAISLADDEIAFLSKSIYVQVYLVCMNWSANSGYFDKPLILAGSDGENFFGKSEVSIDMETLKDRDTLMSNLYYQEYFQRVAFECLDKFYPSLKKSFIDNYSKRLVSHFMRIRIKSNLANYIKSIFEINKIKIKYSKKYLVVILLVVLIPKFVLNPMYDFLIRKYGVSGG